MKPVLGFSCFRLESISLAWSPRSEQFRQIGGIHVTIAIEVRRTARAQAPTRQQFRQIGSVYIPVAVEVRWAGGHAVEEQHPHRTAVAKGRRSAVAPPVVVAGRPHGQVATPSRSSSETTETPKPSALSRMPVKPAATPPRLSNPNEQRHWQSISLRVKLAEIRCR